MCMRVRVFVCVCLQRHAYFYPQILMQCKMLPLAMSYSQSRAAVQEQDSNTRLCRAFHFSVHTHVKALLQIRLTSLHTVVNLAIIACMVHIYLHIHT